MRVCACVSACDLQNVYFAHVKEAAVVVRMVCVHVRTCVCVCGTNVDK